ncbi:MAG: glycosyltransferase [Ignavibacteriales bacterium]|nr:glycosyltransferase [Ignavibacteriaceae bacterium]NLH60606.1 glycosyltransferase [Ignavibacteriales bacterium]HOJ17415.1 glycosyltransferase [Ignavibacteriaceae bacterium]HPO56379.1 glycosyltransferase [Ignavibacteriaceae bacterium]
MNYSIIIPTLNEEKLLPNILNQLTEANLKEKFGYEIIISDGGSTDKTFQIASKYADKIVYNEGNFRTIAIGRNEGARVAKGSILIFINGDILFEDPLRFFSFVHEKFVPSEFSAMTCRVKVFPEEETQGDKIFHGFYNNYFKCLNKLGMGMGRGECQVIRKEVFEKVGGNLEHLTAGEDFDLYRRIKKTGKILFVDEICVYESPRRYRKLGYFNVTLSWLKNSVSVVLKKKSLSREWEQVR